MSLPQAATDYFKFCPGEEHVKISNAICRGRRRANYPKCPGCQFNEDESKTPNLSQASMREATAALDSVFYPGGIRATYPAPLSTEVAWRIGHAAAQFLHGRLRGYERASPGSKSIVVSRDTRPGSIDLQRALADGIRSVGMDVVDIGVADTPQMSFAIGHFNACGGIQTTGGTKPAEFNGFKMRAAKGAAIGEQTGLAGIRDIAMRVPRHQTGMTARLREVDLSVEYAAFVRGALRGASLPTPMRVVVDAGHGVAAQVVPAAWRDLDNLELIVINGAADGPYAHDPDPVRADCLADLRAAVKDEHADFGIAFSGDADRCALVDEKDVSVSSDAVVALLARRFLEQERGAVVVLDQRAGMAARDEIERAGGSAVRAAVGYESMRKTMTDTGALLGGDWSGRFYFSATDGGESALLACTHILSLAGASGRRFSELTQPFTRFRTTGELTLDCPDPDRALANVAEAHDPSHVDRGLGVSVRYEDWGLSVRKLDGGSAVGVVIEAKTKKLLEQRQDELRMLLHGGDRAAAPLQ